MRQRGGQGEALVSWAVWGLTAIAVVTTYARVDPAELYHVSGSGLGAGLGRALVHVNWPFALVAVALVLTAMDGLPRSAWWVAGPSIALCATMPFFVDQGDLDARWANAIPAAGVVLALGLTVAAARSAGVSLEERLPFDRWRIVVAAVVLVLSLPWLFAQVGFQVPGDVFMGEELFRTAGGRLEAAVHLGEHHGFHGALLLLTALLLSRFQVASRRLRLWRLAYVSGLAGYGAVNFVQDLWHEQLVKRGWVDERIPSALYPGLKPVTLVTVALAGIVAWLLTRERAILRP